MMPQHVRRWRCIVQQGLACLGVLVLLVQCTSSGDSGNVSPPAAPSPRSELQAIESLLDLYRTAMRQEDIDRLQELLHLDAVPGQSPPHCPPRQDNTEALVEAWQFLTARRADFCALTFTDLQVPLEDIQIAADRRSVAFMEVESVEDPASLVQETRVFRTTFHLIREETARVVTFRITAVRRAGPVVTSRLLGQAHAGALTRVEVQGTPVLFALDAVEVEEPTTNVRQTLATDGERFWGSVALSSRSQPPPLRLHLYGADGEQRVFSHPYRLRHPRQGVVQRIAGTEAQPFLSVAVTPDGTVWGGARGSQRAGDCLDEQTTARRGGRVYRVLPGTTSARCERSFTDDPSGRVEDIALDRLEPGRVHFLVFARGDSTQNHPGEIRAEVFHRGEFCTTVNAFDEGQQYPFYDPRSNQKSASTRLHAAEGGAMWLLGSDGGVARATDGFQDGACERPVAVQYSSVLRRAPGALLSNTVPALVPSTNGALWFGTIFGLTRRHQGQWTALPFDPILSFQGNVATLERFIQEVAEAIRNAQPLATAQFGTVSFLEAFGRRLIKEDLIFSLAEDRQGRLWVGTLGGGIRRLDAQGTTFRETLHLTRAQVVQRHAEAGRGLMVVGDGLSSNIISALAMAPDGAIWAATEEGVSRIEEVDGRLTVTTFSSLDGVASSLDGVALPVHDVAVDAEGIVWLATGDGLLRILSQGSQLQGAVHDPAGQPVAGVDVILQGTPVRAVTDATGRFTLTQVPPGQHEVQFDGALAVVGPFTTAWRSVEVSTEHHVLAPVVLVPQGPRVPVDPATGGTLRFPRVPAATLTIAPGALHVPPGEAATIGLTVLPRRSLPLPVPTALRIGAAAQFEATGATLTAPAQLTLPNRGHLPPGSLVVLLQLDEDGHTYVPVGLGRVSDDGRVISTIQGGVTRLSTVLFVSTPDITQATLVAIAGNGQRGVAGNALARPVEVEVRDQAERGLPGVLVTFTVTRGAGLLEATARVTDTQGRAAVQWTLGPGAGEQQVTAMVFGLPSLTFTATGLVARLIPVSGNNQSGEPGEELPEPLVVRLEDQFGNPVEGASIQAQIIEGLGVLRPIPFPGRCATPGSEDPGTAVESVTNTQGEVAFCLQVDAREDSLILVEVNAPDIPQTEPLRLVTLVGFVIPLDIAVAADGSLLVVDAGLQAVLRVDPVTGERVLVSGVDIDTDPDTEDPVIGRGPTLVFPRGLVASAHGPLLVLDAGGSGFEAIMQVDPVSGDRTLLSGRGQGSGPALQSPTDINLAPDGTPVVVGQSDAGGMAVLRVDPRTGDRTILSGGIDLHSGQPIGAGPPFRVPQSITVTDNSLFVVEAGSNYQAVIRVDPENGDRQVVSGIDPDTGQTLGHGPPFLNPAGIAVQTDGNPVVTDTLHDSIIEVTLSQDGRRQILSGKDPDTELPIGSGPSLTIPQGIAVESDGNLVLVDRGLAAVVRVAPRTRNRMIVSQTRVGHGQPFASPRSVAVESEQTLVVVDNSLDAVLRVDLATGNRMIVSNATTGRGPPLEFPVALAVEADGSLVVVDSAVLDGSAGLRAIVRINPRNGNRDIVSGPTCGGEPGLQFPSGIAIETDGSLVVAEGLIGLNAVVRVDRNSGHCDIVSGGPDDLGERPFSGPRDITVAPDGTLFVIDSEGVVQVDPRTGERRGVSDLAPGFVPSAVAVEADGQHLVVINSSKEEVERINLVNGSRDLVSGQDRGRGVLFFDPQDIVVQPDGTLIVMEGAFGLKAVVQVDSVSGDRTLLAK